MNNANTTKTTPAKPALVATMVSAHGIRHLPGRVDPDAVYCGGEFCQPGLDIDLAGVPALTGFDLEFIAEVIEYHFGEGGDMKGTLSADTCVGVPARVQWWLKWERGSLAAYLAAMAATPAGLDALRDVYAQQVGETPPRRAVLVEFLTVHYERYPEDLMKDFPE